MRIPSIALAGLLLGALTAAETPTTPPDPASPWGFCSSAEWRHESPRYNPLMAQAGVRWVRNFPEWNGNNPAEGVWKWDDADSLVADHTANGMGLTGCFTYFAKWATVKGDTRTLPLTDMAHWRAYVREATKRYKDDIRAWEVYNEFNGSFANSPNKPKDYAELVIAAYEEVKAIDPDIRVGMSCANFDLGFFDGAIKHGAGGHFDFIAVHPYENVGTLRSGGEPGYLSMAGSIRKLLANHDQTQDVGLWITEFGIQSSVKPDAERDALQAKVIVTAHVLALAQGFERICWFEARGPSYGHDSDHGVIRHDWSLRPCYHALDAMTTILGHVPRYRGWIDIDEGGYGFVFDGGAGPVLCAWAPPGETKVLELGAATIADLIGERSDHAGGALQITDVPCYVLDPPAALIERAEANRDQPFPWGGDYANAEQVHCILGATNVEDGLVQTKLSTTTVEHGLDHSWRENGHRGEAVYSYFRVDPRFAGFGDERIEVTIVARRADDKPASVDLTYESLTGYKGTGTRWDIPAGEDWIEHSWTLDDCNFVGGWGWNFRTHAFGNGRLALKEVRVRKLE